MISFTAKTGDVDKSSSSQQTQVNVASSTLGYGNSLHTTGTGLSVGHVVKENGTVLGVWKEFIGECFKKSE